MNRIDRIKAWASHHETPIIKWIWRLTITGTALVAALLLYAGLTDAPSFEELENPKYDEASVIYDDKGRSFGKYYVENREPISFDQLNPHIHKALIATEDARFYAHSGIDFWALIRVAFKTVLLQDRSSGGGSTISQQLAKQLFSRPSMRNMGFVKKTWTLITTKLREWITAVRLERNFTKEEIIALYLNKFEFINGAHGIQSAAQTYFGKNQNQLNVAQSALLVGMLQNPSLYNPRRFPDIAKERRNTVLKLLSAQDYISKVELDSISARDIDMTNFMRSEQSDGPAPYFRVELTKWLRDLFERENIRKPDGTTYNIYTDGLTINTTIDLDYQRYAEESVAEHMKWLQKRYDRVWKNQDPWTYEADSLQKIIRQDILSRRMKASERYANLREKNLGQSLEAIQKKYTNLPTSDNVFKALIEISEGKSSFKKQADLGNLDMTFEESYKKLLVSEAWPSYKEKFLTHEAIFIKEFDTPVKMMIFDHELGEKEVEMTPRDSVRHHNMHLQNATLAVDPKTGYIKAWVGGINHKYFKYDHATSRRAVGSTIKPFVYTSAMAFGGISPCQEFDDIQYTIAPGDAGFDVDKEWSPANANEEFTGNKYNLYHGLLYSKNSITVRLLKELGNVEILRNLLEAVGINTKENIGNGKIAVPSVPSISLGAVDLRVIDMLGAYTTFANQGVYTEPIFIKNIIDRNGKVIYTAIPKRKAAINPLYNAVMVDMLRNNTGGQFGMGLKSQYGGKTGTTNDYADGWFMGVTPSLVVAVWTGGDDKWIRFTNIDDGQGYVMARPIFQNLLKRLEKDSTNIYDPNIKFANPPAGFSELIDCAKFKQLSVSDERESLLNSKVRQDRFDESFEEEFNEEF